MTTITESRIARVTDIGLEHRQALADIMRTPEWSTEAILDISTAQIEFEVVEPDPEPPGVEEIVREAWQGALQKKQAQLVDQDIMTEISFDEATQSNALWRISVGDKKRIMWNGPQMTLTHRPIDYSTLPLKIPVTDKFSYADWLACFDPRLAQAYREVNYPLRYAGFGTSVFLLTTDGLIPFTIRGLFTPILAGALYTPGGAIQIDDKNPLQAQIREIGEELGLVPKVHYNPWDMMTLAMVNDTNHGATEHSRPELIHFLPLRCDWNTLSSTQRSLIEQGKVKEADVWALTMLPGDEYNLTRNLILRQHTLCPPTAAGAAHVLRYRYGTNPDRAVADLMSRINNLPRQVFQLSAPHLVAYE